MPDWSYQPLFRPWLFRLPPARARDLTLGSVGTLARLPGGTALIGLLGHMDPPPGLEASLCGRPLRGPLGLAATADPHLLGTRALAYFGFGFLEVGPVTLAPLPAPAAPRREVACHALRLPDVPANDGLERVERRLARLGRLGLPLLVRLAHAPGADPAAAIGELRTLAARLAPYAAAFVLEPAPLRPPAAPRAAVEAIAQAGGHRPLLLAIRPSADMPGVPGVPDAADAAGVPEAADTAAAADAETLGALLAAGADGYVVGGGLSVGGGRLRGPPALPATLATVVAVRAAVGPHVTLIADDGVVEPAAALALRAAGASLILLHSGLVYAGPGLPKRINEAIIATSISPNTGSNRGPRGSPTMGRRAATSISPNAGSNRDPSPSPSTAWATSDGRATRGPSATTIGADAGSNSKPTPAPARASAAAATATAVGPFAGSTEATMAATVAVPATDQERPAAANAAWLALLLLGLAMLLGGSLAWLVAAVSVTLPYDDAFLGLDRAGLAAISPRILPFMAHDRVTLAGTMLSIGVLYTQLAWWGVRRGAHWAWLAIVASAGVGFASFFLFLGFGYFDPLHAAVSVVLFGVFLAGLRNRPRGLGPIAAGLHNDRAWWLSLWGQLCFVGIGLGLILAGLQIARIGITAVLVPEDIGFLGTDPAVLRAANAHLLPLIAHDRAGFGGALVSNGLGVLLLALWGFRSGAGWVWWTLLLGGLPGFVAAFGVHAAIGYDNPIHLAPAFVAVALYAVGLGLSYPFLCCSARRTLSAG